MRHAFLALALVSLSTPVSAAAPNVVFILADDLGYGDVGCFGQQRFETPHIDALAARGIRLTQHYAGSTVCAPSRCALLTGLHTGHAPIRGNTEHRPEGQLPMPGAMVTLPDLLRHAGYTTGAFGKWGLGYPGSESDPLHSGFDRFFGYNCQRHAHRYFTDYLWDDNRRTAIDPAAYTPDLIMGRAAEFLRADHGGPFFCYLAITLPHAAMEAPEAARAPHRKRFARFESRVGEYAGVRVQNPVASFAAMVGRVDELVGEVTAILEERGLAEETLVVFTSDNGPHREGGHDPEFFDSNGPFRGFKRDLYEGGIRVPTIVAWPGSVPAGATSDLASAGWDWLPTIGDVAGVDVPAWLDGVSLAPTLLGRGRQTPHEDLYWEFHEQGGKQALRRGDWKAVRLDWISRPDGPIELYNLSTDPGETRNVAAAHPEVAADLARRMSATRVESLAN